MDTLDLVRAVAALAVVLGLIGLAGYIARRWGPSSLFATPGTRRDKRLRVVETLMLDPQRRLVLVSLDGAEQLLLLGEGRVVPPPLAGEVAAKPSEGARLSSPDSVS